MNALVNTASTINPGIKQVHDELIARHSSLSDLLGSTSSPSDAEAILREMQEVNFRVMISGSLLFKQTTAKLDANIAAVTAASARLDESLSEAQRIQDIVKATGRFLTLVDKLLDAIKLV